MHRDRSVGQFLAGIRSPLDPDTSIKSPLDPLDIRRFADRGDAVAQYNLGMMYLLGRGVAKNYNTAVFWLRKSANQGSSTAQYNLGVMYYDGREVATNYIEAYKWLSLSRTSGNRRAGEMLHTVRKSMTPAQITEAKKRVALFKIDRGDLYELE